MAERGTLRLDTGEEVRVEIVERAREGDEIVVRATADDATAPMSDLLEMIDSHLVTAAPHAAGTTDRLLAADRGSAV